MSLSKILCFSLATSPLAAAIDHVATIQSLAATDVAAGKVLYTLHCVSCHGEDGNHTQNPLARGFARDELKFGADPYSLWRTTSYGNGLMFRWDAVLSERERYQVVHYIRETFIRNNGSHYAELTPDYFDRLPARVEADFRQFAPAATNVVVAGGMFNGAMGRQMIYGPAQSHSIVLRSDEQGGQDAPRNSGTTEKGLVIALPGEAVICYDTGRLSVSGMWDGRMVDTDRSHHSSYKGQQGLTPGSTPTYVDVGADGWRIHSPNTRKSSARPDFHGYFLHGEQVLLSYSVASRKILELPDASPEHQLIARHFEIAAGDSPLYCLVGRLPGGAVSCSPTAAMIDGDGRALHVSLSGEQRGLRFSEDAEGGLWLLIPPGQTTQRFTVWYRFGLPVAPDMTKAVRDLTALTRGGPRRWAQPVTTPVVRGAAVDGYAADEITVPFANPWGSWMRLTALDFFLDGRMAVSTLSGDVWIVTPDPSGGDQVSWSRFANGLYEPLGLRIVDETIHVRCRDRIVRLRDVNSDGEADFYESFYNEPGEIGTGYHAFIFELQTDQAGNFYYTKSGRKSPHKAAVVRVSADGRSSAVLATDMRHPNGMGAGGPKGWITVSDNPSGQAIFNGVSLVQEGASFGYEQPRNVPMLAVLPASADASSTGQTWSDPERWGPLGGSILHTSYSHCAMFYIMVEDVAPFPNGFAVRLPFEFKAGLMRSRVNPVDGQVYTVGLKGWDTRAGADGCLYRIRYTGEKSRIIREVTVTTTGLKLAFTCDLDPASLDAQAVVATRQPGKKGDVASVALGDVWLSSPRVLHLVLPGIEDERVERRTRVNPKTGELVVEVRNPITITVNLRATDGSPIQQTVYATLNSVP